MMSVVYSILFVVHLLATMIAVGSATVVDYLHLVGLRKKKLERGLVSIYPFLSRMINYTLIIIYITGAFLLYNNPYLLQSPMFIIKLALVLIVTINGIYLQRSVSPHLDKCVLKGTKYCTNSVLNSSAIAGSVSIVTWYGIVILSLTKNFGYSTMQFIFAYLSVLMFAIIVAYSVERKARKWRS
jgi:hypothetical protein